MRKYVFLPILLCILLVISPFRNAYSGTTKSPSFLELSPDARTRALGNGLIGLAEGGASKFYNPGGVSGSENPLVQSLYEPGFEQYSSFSLSFSGSNFGIAYRGLGTEEIIARDLHGQPTGDVFHYHSHGVIGSFGWNLDDFGTGISMKGFYRSVSDSQFGYSLTPGVVYERAPFRVGAVLPDLLVSDVSLAELGAFSSGKELKFGVGVVTEPLNLGLDVKAELDEGEPKIGIAGAGLEWWLSEFFALRIGTNENMERSFGFGVKGGKTRIDYAYTFHEELPNSYVVSLGWVFGS